MSPSPARRSGSLSTRVFAKPPFAIAWAVFLGFLVLQFWWVRDLFLVWWVYGRDGYFRDGIRVLPGKPIRFSTGELAPQWPDLVTGFAFFFVVVLGLTALLLLGLCLHQRHRRSRDAA